MQGLLSRNLGISSSGIFMEMTTDLNDRCNEKQLTLLFLLLLPFFPGSRFELRFEDTV